jgi:uncharacterized protein (DUF2342 family)
MIDFISSNPSAHPQTVACARLLAAVIAQAIEDASSRQATGAENFAAVDWLFSKTSAFEDYARLIGADAGQIRTALLEPPPDIEPKSSRFDASKRRYLRSSYTKWLTRRKAEEEALKAATRGKHD